MLGRLCPLIVTGDPGTVAASWGAPLPQGVILDEVEHTAGSQAGAQKAAVVVTGQQRNGVNGETPGRRA